MKRKVVRLIKPAMFAALLFTGSACTAFPGAAQGSAPTARGSGPGWYTMALGQYEVTALSDGTQVMPVQKLLQGITPEQTRRALQAAFLPQPYRMNFNAFLVDTGHKLILIDTGAGHFLGKDLGTLVEHLEASGYRPDEVDEIDITHMHPDHIGGLSVNGRRVFRNAIVRVNRREADYWLSQANADKAAPDQKVLFADAKAALQPYIRAGHFKPFDGDTTLGPGIRAVALYGHTPGHTGYMVESDGEKMLIWGDVIHVPAVQFANPAVTIDFDWNGKGARATRERVLAEAVRNGWLIAGAHIAFPGLGHVVKDDSGYRWIPVAHTNIRSTVSKHP